MYYIRFKETESSDDNKIEVMILDSLINNIKDTDIKIDDKVLDYLLETLPTKRFKQKTSTEIKTQDELDALLEIIEEETVPNRGGISSINISGVDDLLKVKSIQDISNSLDNNLKTHECNIKLFRSNINNYYTIQGYATLNDKDYNRSSYSYELIGALPISCTDAFCNFGLVSNASFYAEGTYDVTKPISSEVEIKDNKISFIVRTSKSGSTFSTFTTQGSSKIKVKFVGMIELSQTQS